MSELEWLDNFGDFLLGTLEDRHMSQRELARESGLSECTISRYINKTQMPNVRAILNISYALDCDISDLIDYGEMIE